MSIVALILTIGSLFPLSSTSKESLVESGIYTSIKKFPYCAFLLIELVEGNYGCGASILNQNFVLTAAHCLTFVKDEDKVSITVGHEVFYKGKMYEIAEFRMHEKHQAFKNDIAVARTLSPIVLGENVKRISLMEHPPRHREGFVAGWGLVNVSYESYFFSAVGLCLGAYCLTQITITITFTRLIYLK